MAAEKKTKSNQISRTKRISIKSTKFRRSFAGAYSRIFKNSRNGEKGEERPPSTLRALPTERWRESETRIQDNKMTPFSLCSSRDCFVEPLIFLFLLSCGTHGGVKCDCTRWRLCHRNERTMKKNFDFEYHSLRVADAALFSSLLA